MKLVITYDNESMQDGIGSQALRILGLYSISKFFRISYLHSPIIEVIEEFSHKAESDSEIRKLVEEASAFFEFPSTPNISSDSKVIHVRQISLRKLFFFRMKSLFSKQQIIIKVLLPFGITDRFPFIYDAGVKFMRAKHKALIQKRNFVVAHMRFGYGYLYSDQRYIRPRNLPFSYFEDLIIFVSRKYFSDNEFRLIVHTDLSPESRKWKPVQKVVLDGFKEVSANSELEEVEIEGIRVEEKISLPEKCKAEFHYCDNLFDTFLDMVSCEILILGNSSFSYLAGLLNENVVIWPSVHGHSKHPRWISSKSCDVENTEELVRG